MSSISANGKWRWVKGPERCRKGYLPLPVLPLLKPVEVYAYPKLRIIGGKDHYGEE